LLLPVPSTVHACDANTAAHQLATVFLGFLFFQDFALLWGWEDFKYDKLAHHVIFTALPAIGLYHPVVSTQVTLVTFL
jgi:hypothetical protein